MRTNSTVQEIVNANLCTGCGTCMGMCPNSAICLTIRKGSYIPQIDEEKCLQCGMCLKVCPGSSVDFPNLNQMIFGQVPIHPLIGNYTNCYLGNSTNKELHYNSSSGGLVTQLLIVALEAKLIDGALVTKMNPSDPLKPTVYIAKTKDEIKEASKSKYCPVPLNTLLEKIKTLDGRFAVVGLPCHIEGIRKAEALDEQLKNKIVLHLGLACNHAPTFNATDYLLKKLKIRAEHVKKIDYRGEGWPGCLSVFLSNGEKKTLAYSDPFYWGYVFSSYFCTSRCFLCVDKINELSDLSFCDAWGKSVNNAGNSLVVSRTKIGEDLIECAMKSSCVILKKESPARVIDGQGLSQVKRRYTARTRVIRGFGQKIPDYNQPTVKSAISDYIGALASCMQMNISSQPLLWPLIDLYPFLIKSVRKRQRASS
jgi:coenzyme F420 hydrogenase subunit beta